MGDFMPAGRKPKKQKICNYSLEDLHTSFLDFISKNGLLLRVTQKIVTDKYSINSKNLKELLSAFEYEHGQLTWKILKRMKREDAIARYGEQRYTAKIIIHHDYVPVETHTLRHVHAVIHRHKIQEKAAKELRISYGALSWVSERLGLSYKEFLAMSVEEADIEF